MAGDIERDSPNPLAAVADLLSASNDKVKKALSYYVIGVTAWRTGMGIYRRVRSELSHTITVESDDSLYADVMTWLYDSLPENKRRSLSARSGRSNGEYVEAAPRGRKKEHVLQLFYDGNRSQTVEIDGYKIRIDVEKNPEIFSTERGYSGGRSKITFTCPSLGAREAVILYLHGIVQKREQCRPRLYSCTAWGDWDADGDVPNRGMETVVLPNGDADELLNDIEGFLNSKEEYERLGVPWHRGLLFYGPPGTGKTTLVKALANQFNLDLYFMSLSDVQSDTNLINTFRRVKPRSILLLEDVDVVHGLKERDDQSTGVSMSAVLNALDGVATPDGVIVIMTTNHVETLDPAVLRPGRVDRRLELSYMDNEQADRVVKYLTGDYAKPVDVQDLQLTPADFVGVAKNHIGDLGGTMKAIHEVINEKKVQC